MISHVSSQQILEADSTVPDPAHSNLPRPRTLPPSASSGGSSSPARAELFLRHRPYLIKNVQTGRLLDADIGNQTITSTPLRLLGHDGQNNRHWRFFAAGSQKTNGGKVSLLTPFFAPPATPPGVVNFAGMAPTVKADVKLVGDGTNELQAQVTMTATGNGVTLSGTRNYSLVKLPLGRKIILAPSVPFPPSETCTYTDNDTKPDIVVPGKGKIGTLDLKTGKITDPAGTDINPATLEGVNAIISFCLLWRSGRSGHRRRSDPSGCIAGIDTLLRGRAVKRQSRPQPTGRRREHQRPRPAYPLKHLAEHPREPERRPPETPHAGTAAAARAVLEAIQGELEPDGDAETLATSTTCRPTIRSATPR